MINNFDPSRRASKPKWAQSSWSIDDPFPLPYLSKSLLPIFQRHQSIKINNAHTVEKLQLSFNKYLRPSVLDSTLLYQTPIFAKEDSNQSSKAVLMT